MTARDTRPVGGTILLVLLAFMLLYNVAPQGAESLTSGRVAVLVLAVMTLLSGRNPLPRAWLAVALPLVFLPVALAQSVLTGDFGQTSRFVNLAVYAYAGGALLATLCGSPRVLLRVLFTAAVLQSLVILFSFFSLDYRVWFDGAIATSANFDPQYLYRAPGFSSDGGAALSVVQSLGVMAAWLLAREGRREPARGDVPVPLLLAGALLCLLSCLFVGRTGLLLSGVFLLPLVAVTLRTHLAWTVALVGGLAAAVGVALESLLSSLGQDFSVEYFLTWAFGLFSGQDETLDFLAGLPIPPLSVDTFFGTGQVSLTANGSNPSGHDSGFVQTYYALGLLASIPFYAAYLVMLLAALRWLPLPAQATLAAIFFLLELKEPFLFKYALPLVLIALFVAHDRQRRAAPAARPSDDAHRAAGQLA